MAGTARVAETRPPHVAEGNKGGGRAGQPSTPGATRMCRRARDALERARTAAPRRPTVAGCLVRRGGGRARRCLARAAEAGDAAGVGRRGRGWAIGHGRCRVSGAAPNYQRHLARHGPIACPARAGGVRLAAGMGDAPPGLSRRVRRWHALIR